jgi:hypothetical protein
MKLQWYGQYTEQLIPEHPKVGYSVETIAQYCSCNTNAYKTNDKEARHAHLIGLVEHGFSEPVLQFLCHCCVDVSVVFGSYELISRLPPSNLEISCSLRHTLFCFRFPPTSPSCGTAVQYILVGSGHSRCKWWTGWSSNLYCYIVSICIRFSLNLLYLRNIEN